MKIWLKNGAEERLEALKEQGQGLLENVAVETHRTSGKKYVVVYEDVFDPASNVASFPEELIEKGYRSVLGGFYG